MFKDMTVSNTIMEEFKHHLQLSVVGRFMQNIQLLSRSCPDVLVVLLLSNPLKLYLLSDWSRDRLLASSVRSYIGDIGVLYCNVFVMLTELLTGFFFGRELTNKE